MKTMKVKVPVFEYPAAMYPAYPWYGYYAWPWYGYYYYPW
jgi:hypothetical protein